MFYRGGSWFITIMVIVIGIDHYFATMVNTSCFASGVLGSLQDESLMPPAANLVAIGCDWTPTNRFVPQCDVLRLYLYTIHACKEFFVHGGICLYERMHVAMQDHDPLNYACISCISICLYVACIM